jgi:hypothetical protein
MGSSFHCAPVFNIQSTPSSMGRGSLRLGPRLSSERGFKSRGTIRSHCSLVSFIEQMAIRVQLYSTVFYVRWVLVSFQNALCFSTGMNGTKRVLWRRPHLLLENYPGPVPRVQACNALCSWHRVVYKANSVRNNFLVIHTGFIITRQQEPRFQTTGAKLSRILLFALTPQTSLFFLRCGL